MATAETSPGVGRRSAWWAVGLAAAGGAVGGLATVASPLWLTAGLLGLLGLVAAAVTWPVGPFLVLQMTALVTHYAVEVGPVSVRAEHVMTILLAGALVWGLWRSRQRPIIALTGVLAIAWWATNILATLVNSVDPSDSVRHIVRLGLMVGSYIVTVNLLRTPQAWRLAVIGFLSLGVLEAAYGLATMLLYQVGIDVGLQVHRHIPIPIPYGTLEEGNIYGSHAASWALAFLWLLLARWHTRGRPWYVAGCLVTLAAAVFSFARGAWLALGLVGLLAFILYRPGPVGRLRRATALVLLIPLLLVVAIGVVQLAPADLPLIGRLQTFGQLGSDATFVARLADYQLAISDWVQHPWIGWGPGAFYQLHGLRRWEPAWISNLTLRTLQETGIFGLLFFGGFVALVVAEAIGAARTAGKGDRALLMGLALGLVCLMIAYQSTDGIWLAAPWVHMGLLTAGARVLAPAVNRPKAVTQDPVRAIAERAPTHGL